MRMTRRIWIQIAIFLTVAIVGFSFMVFGYVRVPALLGFGQYEVTVQLPEAGGLYERANVTYRGTEVGEVKKVNLTDSGVDAVLSLNSDVKIPSDLEAEVHSQSAVGEQYVALLPRNSTSPPLRNGDVIASKNTSVPPDINALLDATNRGLQAIPQDNLRTTVDESYTAFAGLGPEIARFIKGGAALATDAKANLAELNNVVDNVAPILDTQTDTSDSVQAWAAHLAAATASLKNNDGAFRGTLQNAPAAAEQVRALFDRLKPSLPILLTNLVALGQVAVTYRADLEEILVLLPTGTGFAQAIGVPNRDQIGSPYAGGQFLSFNLNLNLPPPCTTGFLPAQQQRSASLEDYPDAPKGTLYCRIPQDSPNNVRGARNIPCETKPGKRAALVSVCESDEPYVPLNDGYNWKGDPNATLSGQGVPEFGPGEPVPPGYPPRSLPPGAVQPPAAPPPLAVTNYDPATGTYVGPDGKVYTQTNLANSAPADQTWQSMLMPPASP
jgi:phospholipid/cholesterol/gamma-HCH transport system substrate-binding protein